MRPSTRLLYKTKSKLDMWVLVPFKVQPFLATRGSSVHNSIYGNIFGGIPKILVLYNFLKILMVSDKMIHGAFRTHTTL